MTLHITRLVISIEIDFQPEETTLNDHFTEDQQALWDDELEDMLDDYD